MILNLTKTYIVLIVLLSLGLHGFSQNVKLHIEAPKEVLLKEDFKISFVIDSDEEISDSPEIADIKGLDILYGPSFSQSSSITTDNDGKRLVKYAVAYSYILKASKSGKVTIPKFEIEIDGKKYESSSASIKVVSSPNQTNKDAARNSDSNEKKKNKIKKIVEDAKVEAFIKTLPSKTRVNPSDTLSVTYKLYTTSEDFKIADLNLPSSRMFYSQTFRPKNEQGQQEMIKGVKYYVYDLYKTLLQPRDAGSLTIDDGDIKLIYYIKTGQKLKNYRGEEYDAIGEKVIDLKIDGISVNVFELTEI